MWEKRTQLDARCANIKTSVDPYSGEVRMLPIGKCSRIGIAGLLAACTAACGSSDEGTEPVPGEGCAANEVLEGGECVLDPYRHEPADQLDTDNVVLGNPDDPLQLIALPAPPKSGFRLVMEPRFADPGDEFEECHSWPIPNLNNTWVYTAELHTSPGLHHANLYALKIDETEGAQPYPKCRGRADVTIFGQINTILSGADTSDLFIPNVLFANSTQVLNTERYALPDGYAYEVGGGLEVMTDVHIQNTTPDRLRVEAAWDFYTMPLDLVTHPSGIFVYFWLDFLLPPRGSKTLTTTCNWAGGEVASIMPHTHQWATGFTAEFGSSMMDFGSNNGEEYNQPAHDGWMETLETPYSRKGTGLADSDIETYDPAIVTENMNAVRFSCEFDNTTDHDMCFGIGENEMCFLFGYTTPLEAQRTGIILAEGARCITFNPAWAGRRFNFDEWLQTETPDIQQKLGNGIFGSRGECPYQQ